MTDQASQLVALVKADGAAKLAKQQALNAAARARIVADAAARDGMAGLHQWAAGLTEAELATYETRKH
jgi:hypothetical protein